MVIFFYLRSMPTASLYKVRKHRRTKLGHTTLISCLTILPAGVGQFDPSPSGHFSVALKPFELLAYKFVTFIKYKLNTFSQKILGRSIFSQARPNFFS